MTKFLSFLVNGIRKLGIVENEYVYEVKDFSSKEFGETYKLNEIQFDLPINPSAIICTLVNSPGMIGVKDKREAKEMIRSPKFFLKIPSIAVPHKHPIISPPDAIRPEVEIGVITYKKINRGASRDEIKEAILGYTVFNDITYPPGLKEDSYYAYRRDPNDGKVKKLLMRGTHFRNKVRDTFAPFGPWIVTPEEIDDINSLEMKSYYDDKLIQSGSSEDFIFSIEEILMELAKVLTIPPYSLITSGSIGYLNAEEASEYALRPRNNGLLIAEIEKIGRLENPILIEKTVLDS
ncbi:fumarylacetoacetate hydrolase family protein [Sulfurisphaera javensis]|uniref:Fumarylacetoacetate hydrolase family protein n=1 Tax=Sulfurisphaera javensis TaxID=2049879 RepID=A0AAT9GSJ3_9CREN